MAGGVELALTCDLIIASEQAIFGFSEVKRGLIAGSGGLLRLPQRIPVGIAMEYSLTGRHMPSQIAHQWGLVNTLTPAGLALDTAVELASEIAANAPLSLVVTKELVSLHAHPDDWDEARQDELLDQIVNSLDAREGAVAFSEKRAPVWQPLTQ